MEVVKAALRTHVTVTETGDSPFAVRIEAGPHVLAGDEPASVGGAGLGPNPFELLAASLSECTAMTIRWYARAQGWPLEHVAVSVDHQKKVLVGDPRIVDVFQKSIAIRGNDLTEDQRSRLLEVAGKCPVQRILEGTPVITCVATAAFEEVIELRVAELVPPTQPMTEGRQRAGHPDRPAPLGGRADGI